MNSRRKMPKVMNSLAADYIQEVIDEEMKHRGSIPERSLASEYIQELVMEGQIERQVKPERSPRLEVDFTAPNRINPPSENR